MVDKIGQCSKCEQWDHVVQSRVQITDDTNLWFGSWAFKDTGTCWHCNNPNAPNNIRDTPDIKEAKEKYGLLL